MDQRSDDIRQDIEATRASLGDKLNLLEDKANEVVEKTKQSFDIKHQVAERPWTMLGVAVAAGYMLGSIGSDSEEQRWHGQPITTTDYNQHAYSNQPSTTDKIKEKSADFLAQFDDEIEMLKGAAITTLTAFIRDSVREYVPAMSQQIDAALRNRGLTPSSSTSGSFSSPNTSAGSADYDSIGQTNRYGAPPPNPSNTGDASEYYDVYTPDQKKEQERAVNETRHYTQ